MFTGVTLLLAGRRPRDDGYDVTVASADGNPCSTGTGLELVAAPLPDPGTRRHRRAARAASGIDACASTRDVIDWIRAVAPNARRVVSVCTGAFLAAQAGLLDGCRATTHWAFAEQLAREFPAVDVDPEPIFVRSSE